MNTLYASRFMHHFRNLAILEFFTWLGSSNNFKIYFFCK